MKKERATTQTKEQAAGFVALIEAAKKTKQPVVIAPGTDLEALRNELVKQGLMSAGDQTPTEAALGLVKSAKCVRPTAIYHSTNTGNKYLRESWEIVDSEKNNFTAFTLNDGEVYEVGDVADLEVVENERTQSGKSIQFVSE